MATGGFYAFTSLSPDPAQSISTGSPVQLQFGSDLDDDYGYFGSVFPGFDLDNSSSPPEQIVIPDGSFDSITGRIVFLVPGAPVDVSVALVVTDSSLTPITSDTASGTVTSAFDNTFNFSLGSVLVPGGGYGFLTVEVTSSSSTIEIADNGFIQVDYTTADATGRKWFVGYVGWTAGEPLGG